MKKSIRSVFLAFVFLTVLLSGCAPASTPVPPTLTLIPPTFTPEPTATQTPVPPTETATPEPTINPEVANYNTIDINRPLETCPISTDIDAYYEWLENTPVEPFGPNAKLRPLRIWDSGDPPYTIMIDPTPDKDLNDPSTWSFRQSPNIVCYKSGQYTYLLFPTYWLNPNDRNKPYVTLSGYLYDYGFGTKLSNKELSRYIKAWLSHKPSFWYPAVNNGGSWGGGQGNEEDFLETKTARRYSDIRERMYRFINTGNAHSVSAPDIILEPMIILN